MKRPDSEQEFQRKQQLDVLVEDYMSRFSTSEEYIESGIDLRKELEANPLGLSSEEIVYVLDKFENRLAVRSLNPAYKGDLFNFEP